MNRFFITLLLFIWFGSAVAQISLPSFFSDNLVLQRNSEVKFWGWANRGTIVTVEPSWAKEPVKVKTNPHSRFDVVLKTPEAGGPYHITIRSGKDQKILQNVLIGEVWFCSGQSNMQWNSRNKLQEMLDELPNAKNPNIRLLQVANVAAYAPQDNTFGSWQECNSGSADGFSAIAYFYAKQLNEELKVPVGVIDASWGGTPAESWTPLSIIERDDELMRNAKRQKPSAARPHEPGLLWNSMVYPMSGYGIAGFLWYQGETNIITHSGYHKLFSRMISAWREQWGKEYPFYYVQIAPYDYKSKPEEQRGALLREQQVKTLTLPNTGMVVVTDLVPDVKNIHPARKKEVAERLVKMSLSDTYGREATDYKSPVYKSHTIQGNKMIILFDYLTNGLQTTGDTVTDLFIAGEDKVFVPASAKINGNKLEVYSKRIKTPKAVRFAFSDTSMSNLFTNSGLPVSPFRTDDW